MIRLWFEHFFILPCRWYRVHHRNWREACQRCKVCGNADGINFDVPNHIWAAAVPPALRNRVVCLRCFDRFAKAKEVAYATSLSELWFVGNKGTLKLEIARAIDVID